MNIPASWNNNQFLDVGNWYWIPELSIALPLKPSDPSPDIREPKKKTLTNILTTSAETRLSCLMLAPLSRKIKIEMD
jgi:hypothetical protein